MCKVSINCDDRKLAAFEALLKKKGLSLDEAWDLFVTSATESDELPQYTQEDMDDYCNAVMALRKLEKGEMKTYTLEEVIQGVRA